MGLAGKGQRHQAYRTDGLTRITDEVGSSGRETQIIFDTTCHSWCVAKALDRLRWILSKDKENKEVDLDLIIALLIIESMDLDRVEGGVKLTDGRQINSNPYRFSFNEFTMSLNLGEIDSKAEKKFRKKLEFLLKEGLICKTNVMKEDGEEVDVVQLTKYGLDVIYNFQIDMQKDWPTEAIIPLHKKVSQRIIEGKEYGDVVPKNYPFQGSEEPQ